ncbi:MAG: polysaccharide deacetylase family protein [Candidatus Omnitrophica bacterium]|nr:polysaccharide deacetylase family protein [Candidatus Omnitrophota bacterium]
MTTAKKRFLAFTGVLLIFLLMALSWQLGRRSVYGEMESWTLKERPERYSESSVVESRKTSEKLTAEGVQRIKARKIEEAIEKLEIAVKVFPRNTQAYGLLAKTYLVTGQEGKMYDVLERAGLSFPSFDAIVETLDDPSLAALPSETSPEDLFITPFPQNKKMAMSFMFDDGESSAYHIALPIFEKAGFRATIPVIAAQVAETDNDPYRGSWHEWKDAADRGFEIANHSMYHRSAREMHGDDFKTLDEAKALIEKNTGHPVSAYVFPFDAYTDEAVNWVLKTHKAIRKPDFLRSVYKQTAVIVYGGPKFSLETANRLVDIGLERRLWLIAECHGVDAKGGKSYKPLTSSLLDAHLSYIRSKSNDVWVDTFSKVFEYLSLRSQTEIEVRDQTADAVDFILHNKGPEKDFSAPLTVALRMKDPGSVVRSAKTADGQALKAYSCGSGYSCVDVGSSEKNVHVEWAR